MTIKTRIEKRSVCRNRRVAGCPEVFLLDGTRKSFPSGWYFRPVNSTQRERKAITEKIYSWHPFEDFSLFVGARIGELTTNLSRKRWLRHISEDCARPYDHIRTSRISPSSSCGGSNTHRQPRMEHRQRGPQQGVVGGK